MNNDNSKTHLLERRFCGTQQRRRPMGGRKNHAVGGNARTIPNAGGKSLLHLPTRYPAGAMTRRSLKLRHESPIVNGLCAGGG